MKRITAFSIILSMMPEIALAKQNSPEVIIFSSLAMLILVIGVFIFQSSNIKRASDPENDDFANQNNFLYKMNARLNLDSIYRIEVYRQSGNIERVDDSISGKHVAERILTSMRRASITSVSIVERSGGFDVRRAIYNGRGRQEGKRIGGYFIVETSSPLKKTKLSLQEKTENQVLIEDQNIEIASTSDAESALIKSWHRIASQIPTGDATSIMAFIGAFDKVTGKGVGVISHVDLFIFLSFIDKYLVGEAEITPAVRNELIMSGAHHHKLIAEQVGRDRILGIETFDANPQEIKEAFKKWFNLLRFADLVKENRPKVLTLVLTQY